MTKDFETRIKIFAPSKINLTLEIIKKLDNNFHEILSVMQTINLFDEIEFIKTNDKKIIIESNYKELEHNENNLIFKMAVYFINKFKINYGLKIKLLKNIPIGAGLAGGSSDCASTLKALLKLFNKKLSKKEIIKICSLFGSDVPFCFFGGTALSIHTGVNFKKIKNNLNINILLISPNIFISTKNIYDLYDLKNKKDIKKNIFSYKVKKAIENNKIIEVANNFKNDFEEIVFEIYPEIKEIKKFLINNRAIGASMSGTGSSVFGYFIDESEAFKAMNKFKKNLNMCDAKIYLLKIFY
jgi:4-diphosphocytidyl-2-C-methyl-D-erythritol kinase